MLSHSLDQIIFEYKHFFRSISYSYEISLETSSRDLATLRIAEKTTMWASIADKHDQNIDIRQKFRRFTLNVTRIASLLRVLCCEHRTFRLQKNNHRWWKKEREERAESKKRYVIVAKKKYSFIRARPVAVGVINHRQLMMASWWSPPLRMYRKLFIVKEGTFPSGLSIDPTILSFGKTRKSSMISFNWFSKCLNKTVSCFRIISEIIIKSSTIDPSEKIESEHHLPAVRRLRTKRVANDHRIIIAIIIIIWSWMT